MRVFLSGICGTGMTALANILVQDGHQVCGSDSSYYPPMGDYLKTLPIKLYESYSERNLIDAEPDLVVIGNALSRGNPEVEAVLNHNLPYVSMAGALKKFFLRRQKSIVVTGTHGKTTTTSLLAHILNSVSPGASFWIGGIPENFGQPSLFKKNAEWFVLEGDEYDSAFFEKSPKFLQYMPQILILNNLEFDHADIYHSLDDILQQFKYLLRLIPSNGKIIANADDPNVKELLKSAYSPIITYGQIHTADYSFSIQGDTDFDFVLCQGNDEILRTPIPFPLEGLAYNMAATAVTALQTGLKLEKIAESFRTFKGVKRRLENILDSPECLVLDDFAHHPTAVRITLEAVRKKFPDRQLVALFEPRSNTSVRSVFQNEYVASLMVANSVILAPVPRHKQKSGDLLDVSSLVHNLKRKGINAFTAYDHKGLLDYISTMDFSNTVFVIMSNGDFEPFKSQFIQYLKQRIL